MGLSISETAPDFEADTTQGRISFHLNVSKLSGMLPADAWGDAGSRCEWKAVKPYIRIVPEPR